MNAISKDQFRQMEHNAMLQIYQKLLDKGLHPESSVRFVPVSENELVCKPTVQSK